MDLYQGESMGELTFMIGDRVVTAAQFKEQAAKPPPRSSADTFRKVDDRANAKRSDGFLVTGFSPAHLEMALDDHEKARAAQAALLAAGGKLLPKEKLLAVWSQDAFMAASRPKRVRSKPYELVSAAELCAALAVKAGWLRVRVDELMKG